MNILELLEVKDTTNLPKDILDAGRLVDGMQTIYVSMPEGSKKEGFANVIAESVKILLQRLVSSGAISQQSAEKENELLPQEKRIDTTPIPVMQRPKWMEESQASPSTPSPAPSPAPKPKAEKPKKEKGKDIEKATIEDIKAMEKGDVATIKYKGAAAGAVTIAITVVKKEKDKIIGDSAQFSEANPDIKKFKNSSYPWKYWEEFLQGSGTISIKKAGEPEKKVTMDDIRAMEEGDIIQIEQSKSDTYLKIKIGDIDDTGFSGTAYNRDGTVRGNYDYSYNTIESFVNDGSKITITKAEDKKVTLEDIKAVEVGDTIIVPDFTLPVVEKSETGVMCDVIITKTGDKKNQAAFDWGYFRDTLAIGNEVQIIKGKGAKKYATEEDIDNIVVGDVLKKEVSDGKILWEITFYKKQPVGNTLVGSLKDKNGKVTDDIPYRAEDFETFKDGIRQGYKYIIDKNATQPDVTLEDIKALQVGDTVEEPDANVKYTVVNILHDKDDKVMGLVCDIHNYENNTTDEAFYTYWEFWLLKINRGDKLIIKKAEQPKYATIEDIKAMERGDKLDNVDGNSTYDITGIAYDSNIKKDGFYATKTNKLTGQTTENYSIPIKGMKEALDLGFKYVITKGEQKLVTLDDIKALEVGDTIEFVTKNQDFQITKKEEEGLWGTVLDIKSKSEFEDQYYDWGMFEYMIKNNQKLSIIKAKKPQKPEKAKKPQAEQVQESDRFKVGDNTNLGIIQEIWKLPKELNQGDYQYKIDGIIYNERLVTEKFSAPSPEPPATKGKKKKKTWQEETDDAVSEIQTKKLLDRLKDIEF